jgi:hypothetical protein
MWASTVRGWRAHNPISVICFTSDRNFLESYSMQSQEWVNRVALRRGLCALRDSGPLANWRNGPIPDSCTATKTWRHLITSVARATSIGETARPNRLAVLRLIANSNLTGAWTGRSAGFSPFRIRST